jgi:hypothetical protein
MPMCRVLLCCSRWISPDAAGAIDGLNLYVYVGNNPLKYIDPIGHFPLISWDRFVHKVNAYKKNQRDRAYPSR